MRGGWDEKTKIRMTGFGNEERLQPKNTSSHQKLKKEGNRFSFQSFPKEPVWLTP